jgi:hypothetical protein
MTRRYFQTISDELAALVDQRRGPLTIQEFTTLALATACEALPLAQRVEALERRLDALQSQPSTPQPDEMLRF